MDIFQRINIKAGIAIYYIFWVSRNKAGALETSLIGIGKMEK